MRTSEVIAALPKAELHLHIEGAAPADMVRARVASWPSPPPWWRADYRFDSFGHFAEITRQCYERTLTSVEDYHAAATGVFRNLVAQNVRYVEVSFSLGHVASTKLPVTQVVEAIKRAAPASLAVRVFCGVSRNRPRPSDEMVDTVLHLPALDGLDLHGDEAAQGPAAFAEMFAQARRRGLATKAHAGELAGPQSMHDLIDILQVTRIEHGVRAVEDARLVSRLIAEGITLDMCPTSNIKLRVVEGIAAHPIRRFYERGIRVTVNTDNPTVLGCSLTSELHLLAEAFGFSPSDLARLQRNAFQVALLPADARAAAFAELDRVVAQASER